MSTFILALLFTGLSLACLALSLTFKRFALADVERDDMISWDVHAGWCTFFQGASAAFTLAMLMSMAATGLSNL